MITKAEVLGAHFAARRPDYQQVMGTFFDAMKAEMLGNFYKGAPEPWRKCDVPTAIGEVFYHALKLAWVAKHEPENKAALVEYTADVANCAFIAAANFEAIGPTHEQPTLIEGIGDGGKFRDALDGLTAWMEEHLGWRWEEMDLAVGASG